jgi:hypothetical protein
VAGIGSVRVVPSTPTCANARSRSSMSGHLGVT